MSTSNTEYLKLYKNTKLYNGSRYQFYLTNREQAFLAFLGEPFYEATVYYKSLSEPIELKKTFEELDGVTYGSITNEDKTYYFFVDNIRTDSYKKTFMEYTIDWWTTNWSNINCKVANVKRKQLKPNYMEQPYTPKSVTVNEISLTSNFVYMATYIPSTEHGTSYISTIILDGDEYNSQLMEAGNWYKQLALPGADIKDCFVVPLFTIDDIIDDSLYDEFYYVDTPTSDTSRAGVQFKQRFPYLFPLVQDANYHL